MTRPDDETGGFFGRWARLKKEAQSTPAARAPASEAGGPPATELQDASPPQEAGAQAADLPLPSLDSIVPGGDVSAFFQAHVPDALRTAALRKLWTTDPEISGFIEMADYQWDFNNPDAIPGWGSGLDAKDIRRLADRLMGAGDAPEKRTGHAAANPEISEDQEFSVGAAAADAEAGEPDVADTVPQAASTDAAATDVAMQKTPSESGLYVAAKKRRGGALPT